MSEYRMAKRMMFCIVLFCIIVFILPTWLSVKYHEKRTVTHELPINIMVEYEFPYNFKDVDVDCLALNIYYETRGDMDAMAKALLVIAIGIFSKGRYDGPCPGKRAMAMGFADGDNEDDDDDDNDFDFEAEMAKEFET